mgnify:CR=1 FL=1
MLGHNKSALQQYALIEICSFNPRTRMGCYYDGERVEVQVCRFQSTHPYGVRHCHTCMSAGGARFQSTHPHGVRRHGSVAVEDGYVCFNPRTHTGCDPAGSLDPGTNIKFQSTHPHGVRRHQTQHSSQTILFQSTHPYGVRLIDWSLPCPSIFVSIHAPVWGATCMTAA